MADATKPTMDSLPTEIRNEIFRLTIVVEERTEIKPPSSRSRKTHQKAAPSPRPLLVCRQWHAEMLPVYYGANKFTVASMSVARQWIQVLRPTIAPMIRDLCIETDWAQHCIEGAWTWRTFVQIRQDHMDISRLVNGGRSMKGGLRPEAICLTNEKFEEWRKEKLRQLMTHAELGMFRVVDGGEGKRKFEMRSREEFEEAVWWWLDEFWPRKEA